MKIRIPDKIQTSNGEVTIPNIPARTAFERGLVEGWKAGYMEATAYENRWIKQQDIEFIEIGEE